EARRGGRAAPRSGWSPWRRHRAPPNLIVPTAASTGPAPRPPATGMVTWTARSAPASDRHHRGGGAPLGAAAPTVLTGESAQRKIASVGPRGGWSRRRGARPPPDALQVMRWADQSAPHGLPAFGPHSSLSTVAVSTTSWVPMVILQPPVSC